MRDAAEKSEAVFVDIGFPAGETELQVKGVSSYTGRAGCEFDGGRMFGFEGVEGPFPDFSSETLTAAFRVHHHIPDPETRSGGSDERNRNMKKREFTMVSKKLDLAKSEVLYTFDTFDPKGWSIV